MLFLVFFTHLSLAISNYSSCLDNHNFAKNMCSGANAQAPACLAQAQKCARECKASVDYNKSQIAKRAQPFLSTLEATNMTGFVDTCTRLVTSAGGTVDTSTADPDDADDVDSAIARGAVDKASQTKCMAFKDKVATDAKRDAVDDEELAGCVDSCKKGAENETNQDILKKLSDISGRCFSGLPQEPDPEGDLTVADVGDKADDTTGGDPEDGSTTGYDDTTSNNPPSNPSQMPSLASGSPPSVGTDLSQLSMVNWATGPSADNGIFSQVASDVAQAAGASTGFSPLNGTRQNLETASVGHRPARQDQGGANGGGAGVAPPSPYMGGMGGGTGGGSGGGRSAASSGGRGGGPVAGPQLGKVGQNAYYSGGGSQTPAGVSKTSTAKNKRPVYNPKYAAKTDDGGAALLRMFGKNPRAEYNSRLRRQQYADYGKSCLNTVFCGIESRFQELMQDYDTGETTLSDTSEHKDVRGTASEKKGK